MNAQRRRNIALVAHDHKKDALIDWAKINKDTLAQHDLVATGTTGRMLGERVGLNVRCLRSGPLGGDQQLGALICEDQVDMLVFFWDPLEPQPHDPDVRALLRIAVVYDTPTACNRATADYLDLVAVVRRLIGDALRGDQGSTTIQPRLCSSAAITESGSDLAAFSWALRRRAGAAVGGVS